MGAIIKRRDFPAVIKQARQGVFVLAPNVTVPIAAPVLNIGLLSLGILATAFFFGGKKAVQP